MLNLEAEIGEEDAVSLTDHATTPYFRARIRATSSEQPVADATPELDLECASLEIKNDEAVTDSVKDI